MKVTIEIDSGLTETEVIIRCNELDASIINLQNYLNQQKDGRQCLSLTKGETEFFVPINEIYFFETEGKEIHAHTKDKLFNASFKLYELEEMLPGNFMRISKSTIVNLDYIYSITRNITASSEISFTDSTKKALVSRGFYKTLIERLQMRRLGKLNN